MKKFKELLKNKKVRLALAILLIIYAVFVLTPFGQTFFKDAYTFLNLDDNKRFSDNYDLSIRFLDVGKTDAILLNYVGKTIFIDTSDSSFSEDIIYKLQVESTETIDAVFISHYDSDHAGGLLSLMRNFEVKKLYLPFYHDESNYFALEIKKLINEQSIDVEYLKAGDKVNLEKLQFSVLAPDKEYKESNNNSLVFMLNFGSFTSLFTGDMETLELNDLLESGENIDCDLLKVSHHGSKNGLSEKFLIECSPEFSVISVGTNTSGLPNKAATDLLNAHSDKVLRTDKNGEIVIGVNYGDENIYYQTQR